MRGAVLLVLFLALGHFSTDALRLRLRRSEDKDTGKEAKEAFDPGKCPRTLSDPYQPMSKQKAASLTIPKLSLPMTCQGHPKATQFMLVVAGSPSLGETGWLQNLDVPHHAYHDNPRSYHRHHNFGNEAMAYLKFVADHYDCLPEVILFAHAHKQSSWHRTQDLDVALQNMQWTTNPFQGFMYLELDNWWFTTHVKDASLNLIDQQLWPPYGPEIDCRSVINGTAYTVSIWLHFQRGNWLYKAWDLFLEDAGLGPVPEKIRARAGSEFLVGKRRVLRHSRQFYLDCISFLLFLQTNSLLDSYQAGVVFENTWHIIFGEPAVLSGYE